MSNDHEGELVHNGQRLRVPARFEHATATHLYSLLDHAAACRLCDGENYEPLPIVLRDGAIRAAGFTAAVDYLRTDVGPYREWILGIWVGLRGAKAPPLAYVNAASLAFGSMLAGDQGFTFYSPKMLLTEDLPTELGVVHYGIPKERGDVLYQRSEKETHVAATDADGRLLMRASVPTRRGFMTRLSMGFSFLRAFGIRALLRMARQMEILTILAGSAKLRARNARAVAKVDSHTELFAWDPRDCRLEIGSDSEWGRVLQELRFAPSLVCHIPNLTFSFSGPIEQVHTNDVFQRAE